MSDFFNLGLPPEQRIVPDFRLSENELIVLTNALLCYYHFQCITFNIETANSLKIDNLLVKLNSYGGKDL